MVHLVKRIGEDHVFIIAEAGVNHNGDLDTAKRLVDAAVDAQCDAVKFQTFRAENIVTRDAVKANYQVENTGASESQYQMLKRLELSKADHVELLTYCKRKGILFLSTPFDEASADLLEDLGMEVYKIPSGEITNLPFLAYVAQKHKPTILSTGMSRLGEVEEAVREIRKVNQCQLVLLHCVTSYPTQYGEVNLRAMNTLMEVFGVDTGYSDHTLGIEVAIAAVARGARVIEKHFTLDKTMDGPDHRASLTPDELKELVVAIRNVEKALGGGVKKPTPSEESTVKVIRKSVIAQVDIAEGAQIKREMLSIKRPGTGIAPKHIHRLIGKRAKRPVKSDQVIQWQDLA